MSLGNKMSNTTVEMGQSRVTIRLANTQILVLAGMAVSIVFSVWLTTRDLGDQVGSLSANIEGLKVMLNDHEHRIASVEMETQVTAEIQRRVLNVLNTTSPEALHSIIKDKKD